jgi:predicted dehydrogenase/threonine dehydrogenase-like Zn-dependent dehydrogenase
MKQVTQNNRTGQVAVADVPSPSPQPGQVLVRNLCSLVSSGTERAGVDFARKSLLGKAKSRPDLVRQVVSKVRRDGLLRTWKNVTERLDVSQALGYSCAGEVIKVGEGVDDIAIGERVACAGSGYASHAEYVAVPRNLVALIPENVSYDDAVFATIGAIALQGIRRAELTSGETVGVIGLGLMGQITVAILKAYGHPIFGTDISAERLQAAKDLDLDSGGITGTDDIAELASAFSAGHGLDAAIITAATADSGPINLAGEIVREQGRVSVVGDVGLDVTRRTYYMKELDLRISRSYGPGRYDPTFEEHGIDYPRPYVRWTEQRNLEEILRLTSAGSIKPSTLITHRFEISNAASAYELIVDNPQKESFSGVVIDYPSDSITEPSSQIQTGLKSRSVGTGVRVRLGLVGAGNFMNSTIVASLESTQQTEVSWVTSASGLSAADLGRKIGAPTVGSDYVEMIASADVDAVISATRHNLTAKIAIDTLNAGKPVHVEKPLALSLADLKLVSAAESESSAILHVGFNRRFAPLVENLKQHFLNAGTPLSMIYRVNAGWIEPSHWVHDPVDGGGRILGEVCHFIDLLQHISRSTPVRVHANRITPEGKNVLADDNVQVIISFADGSSGTVIYSALGAASQPKEHIEVLGGRKSATLDDFRTLTLFDSSTRTVKNKSGDKGHVKQFHLFSEAVKSGSEPPIPVRELIATTLATLAVPASLESGQPVTLDIDNIKLIIASQRDYS